MREHSSNEKIWVNAFLPSLGLLYNLGFIMFIVVPLGISYLFFKVLEIMNFELNAVVILFAIVISFLFLLLLFVFKFLRNYLPFQIITNDSGINYLGLLKRKHLHWNEIESVELRPIFIGPGVIAVKSKKDMIYIPITMKRRDADFPKLKIGARNQWVDITGNEKPIIPENCPLYSEIIAGTGMDKLLQGNK